MSTRREEQRDNYRDGKDLKYAMPVIVPAVIGGLSWLRNRFWPVTEMVETGNEETDRDVRRNKHIKKRNEEIGVDMATGLALGGINHYSIHQRKQEVVDTFGHIVAAEISRDTGKKILPKDLTFDDLKASENILVKEALRMHRQQFRRSYATNIVSMGGALVPMAENLYDYFRGVRVGDDTENPDNNAIFNARTGKQKAVKADGTIDYDFKSGMGTPLYLGANAIYYFMDRVTRGQNSYDAIQDLRAGVELAKQSKEVEPYLLLNVYNNFVSEFHEHYPNFDNEDATPKRSFTKRLTDGLRTIIPFVSNPKEEPPPFPNAPKSVRGIGEQDSSVGDPISRGVFKYMAEAMFRTYDDSFVEEGRKLNFTIDVFIAMIGDGWVDVDHPKVTEYVAKICANKGLDGLQHIESHLAMRRRELNMPDMPVEQVIDELQAMYRATIREKLHEVPAVADTLTVTVNGLAGPTYLQLDAVQTAELIGANRLKAYLELPYRDDPKELSKRRPDLKEPQTNFTITQTQFDQLRGKVIQRAMEKETEKFKMLSEAEGRTIIDSFAVPTADPTTQPLETTRTVDQNLTSTASPTITPAATTTTTAASPSMDDVLRAAMNELSQLRNMQQQMQSDNQAMRERMGQLEQTMLSIMPTSPNTANAITDQSLVTEAQNMLSMPSPSNQKH